MFKVCITINSFSPRCHTKKNLLALLQVLVWKFTRFLNKIHHRSSFPFWFFFLFALPFGLLNICYADDDHGQMNRIIERRKKKWNSQMDQRMKNLQIWWRKPSNEILREKLFSFPFVIIKKLDFLWNSILSYGIALLIHSCLISLEARSESRTSEHKMV